MVKMAGDKQMILGVGITSASEDQVLEKLQLHLVSRQENDLVMVVTPNPEQIVQAQADERFRSILNESEMAIPDGSGLVIASQLLNLKSQKSKVKSQNYNFKVKSEFGRKRGLPVTNYELRVTKLERIAGIDLAEKLVEFCREDSLRVFLLGGREGVAEIAAYKLNLKSQSYSLKVKTIKNLVRGFGGANDIVHETSREREEMLKRISEFRPQLLLVAYGAPWQERWIASNREELEKAGVKVAMVVGGAFDYWAGKVKRAPKLLRKAGLEWLWRLILEPWRWRRQLRLLMFMRLVIRAMFK